MGPHPAVAAVRLAVRRTRAQLGSGQLLVACSGGADSLALAAAVAFETRDDVVRPGLVTVNHGLQDGSEARALAVARLGADLGFEPATVLTVEVGQAGGPEAAAREARYAALDKHAAALDAWVLLAHTREDQAETVLLGLGRGSGPRSIAGMREVAGRYVRPFLDLDRTTTRATCAALDLPVWDDPHNEEARFRRVRVRHEVLPLLDDVLGGGVVGALARTAVLLQDDLDALDALADDVYSAMTAQDGSLDAIGLEDQPRAVRTRVLRQWLAADDEPGLTSAHLRTLDLLIVGWSGQDGIPVPGGRRVQRRSGRLRVENTDSQGSGPI